MNLLLKAQYTLIGTFTLMTQYCIWSNITKQSLTTTLHMHTLALASISFWSRSDRQLYSAYHIQSKTRLITIMNPIATLIIYTTADCLEYQLSPATHALLLNSWFYTDSTVAYSESLVYCATLGGAFDHNHWSWSAVDDVTIIDHFVKWSRQALAYTLQSLHAGKMLHPFPVSTPYPIHPHPLPVTTISVAIPTPYQRSSYPSHYGSGKYPSHIHK